MAITLEVQHYAKQTSNKRIILLFAFVILLSLGVSTLAQQDKALPENSDRVNALLEAVKSGKIAVKLTDPNEIKAILGEPQKERRWSDDDMLVLDMSYPDIVLRFVKRKGDNDASFKLYNLSIKGKKLDIGGMLQWQRQIIVKNIQDFKKIELRNVDLRNLNLTNEGDYLKDQDFDSLTKWPSPEKLPAGFDPKKLLEEGKNPGLGIRALHEEGINGKGVGIAILDQPLLLGHEEYSSRLIRYDSSKASWMGPQMHGSPIMGIAVGKNCGVAPKAFVFYYAAMTTLEHQIQAGFINEIIKYNETNSETERIRVISISAQPENASNNDAFLKAHKNALDTGILVVTCSSEFLDYGILTLIEGGDPDKPGNYRVGRYGGPGCKLNIPTGNKTISTHQGTNVYQYERGGGMSWAAPYIAGLAALAFQVNPDLQPQTILEQLVKTATHTKAGPVVNPRGFIESIRPAGNPPNGVAGKRRETSKVN